MTAGASPADRPLHLKTRAAIDSMFEAALERLWKHAAASIPEWLPMRYVDRLPLRSEGLFFQGGH